MAINKGAANSRPCRPGPHGPRSALEIRVSEHRGLQLQLLAVAHTGRDSAIGGEPNPGLRVAIIVAGIAGLTAARELFRSGFANIDIFEADRRLGGRTYSIPVAGQHTVYEMGAMRMPFFDAPDKPNSVLGYYAKAFGITTQDFPDPGSTVADTGIYLNGGLGPAPGSGGASTPELLIWTKTMKEPPTDELKAVYKKWSDFAGMVKAELPPITTHPAGTTSGTRW